MKRRQFWVIFIAFLILWFIIFYIFQNDTATIVPTTSKYYFSELTTTADESSTLSTTSVTLSPTSVTLTAIPILVIACNRTSISEHIDQLLKYRPSKHKFPVYVSVDNCANAGAVRSVVNRYGTDVQLLQHVYNGPIGTESKSLQGYYKIARHYKWALDQVFLEKNYSTVIITEDDLNIAPDFFEYFTAILPLLLRDKSLWCISAWNDNGRDELIFANKPELLHRTDFFPGLGWMMLRELWLELGPKWPQAFWDDWMRHPDQRLGRACIRPEISRTTTFGRLGVSKGQYFDKFLRFIKLNSEIVEFSLTNLSYLEKSNYDPHFTTRVYQQSELVDIDSFLKDNNVPSGVDIRVHYGSKQEFKTLANFLKIVDDFRGGVMRMAYNGVVSVAYKNRWLHLTPTLETNWTGYDVRWQN